MPDKNLKWSDARHILAVEMHQKGIALTQIIEVVDACSAPENQATLCES